MNTRKMILIFLLVLPFSLALVLVFQGTVRTAVVIPLLYILWLGDLIFKSLHQSFYWVLLLIIVGLVLMASLRTNKESRVRSGPTDYQQKRSGRVAFWENNLGLFHQGGRSKEYAMQELRNLVLAVLAYRDREPLTPGEIQKRLETEELNMPVEIREWLLSKGPSIPHKSEPYGYNRIMGFLRILGRGYNRSVINTNDKNMERLLKFLEDQLEIKA